MVLFLKPYVKGDQVEVFKANRISKESWHPACVVGVHGGDVYSVRYDGGHVSDVMEERVLGNCIRPRPPLVRFENLEHGDLVHVFHNFTWKLALVLEVLENNEFMVRIGGLKMKLRVGIDSIRVRHCWKDGRWIVIDKGASVCDDKRLDIRRYRVSKLQDRQRNVNAITLHKSNNGPTNAVKRNAPSAANGRLTKRSRTEAYSEADFTMHEDSPMSSVGSCSVNFHSSCTINGILKQLAEQLYANDDDDNDVSDAESCTGPSRKPRKSKC